MLKQEGDYWIDSNQNKWNVNFYTESQAKKYSKSLINCRGCRGCSGCSNYKENPNRYTGNKIGSRKNQTTVYWLPGQPEQVVCGCFKGDLDLLEKAVLQKHKGTVYEKEYMSFINTVRTIRKMEEGK